MMSDPWQVAFVVLQVVFSGVLIGAISALKGMFREIKHLHQRVNMVEKDLAVGSERFDHIHQTLEEIKSAIGTRRK
jgi:hypothetical protein